MDKNTVKGLVLMMLVIFAFMYFNTPSKEEREAAMRARQQAAQQAQQSQETAPAENLLADAEIDAIVPIVQTYGTVDADNPALRTLTNPDVNLMVTTVNDSTRTLDGVVITPAGEVEINALLAGNTPDLTPEQATVARNTLKGFVSRFGRFQSFAPFFYGDDTRVVLGNDSTNMTLTFNPKGGMVEKVVLNHYKNERTDSAGKVTLFTDETGSYSFTFLTDRQRLSTDSLYFIPTEVTDTSVVMALQVRDNVGMKLRYTVDQKNYLVKMEMLQQGMDALIPLSTSTMEYNWHQKMARNEVGRTFEERYSCIYYKCLGETPDDLSTHKNDDAVVNGHIKWVAFKNQFFSSIIIPENSFTNVSLNSIRLENSADFVKDMSMTGTLGYSADNPNPFTCRFYFGPNDYPLLSDLDDVISPEGDDLDLNRLVPLGWGLFRWINQLIVIPVFTFLSSFISNYGIIILLLTIFIKLIIFPFTYKSYKSQAKMRLLAPEIKEINDKYPNKEDAMKKQQETMALYSRAGASPFSGCLPMLFQMPVLIAMFSFFPSAIELRGQSFLWVHDLSAPDSILTLPFTIPFYGNHVSLFCLLMTVTNIIYTRITMQNQPANSSMPGMKWMMYLMPVMFLFFFNDYAAALSYYYFLSLLITIVQTYVIRHYIIDEDKVRQQMLENAKNPRKKKGFMARLEAAQKKQEAYMREQAKQNARKRR